MSPKKISIIVFGTLFALLMTACSGVPNIASVVQLTPTPTIVPATPTPEPTQAPVAQNNNPKNARPQVLAAVLKATGLEGGVVRAINAGTLSIRLRNGAEQAQTDSSTLVIVPGKSSAQVSDIHTGDRVLVEFPDGDTTKPASFIMVVSNDLTIDNVKLGAVQAGKQAGIKIRTPQGAESVATSASTVVVNLSDGQAALGSLKDLMVGNAIVVIGTEDGGAFNAQTIVVVDKDARNLLRQSKPNQSAPQP